MRQRAPKTEAKGTSGQSFVKAEFEEMGWGVVPNPEHDLGTDLWLMARDERRFDLGALVGAQVKNGASFFDGHEELDAGGEVLGWWYPEADDSHFDYWSEHTTPHILVLRDPRTRQAFWVHVTADAIQSTGKGNKILVPRNQTVDEAHRDALTAVATSPTTSGGWDGSAWNAERQVPASELLRYAMVTPRLVAPHPNAHVDNPTAAQALGLLVQLRTADLFELSSPEKREEASDLPGKLSWQWTLFDAAFAWLINGDLDQFESVRPAASSPEEVAAATVMQACALVELGRVIEALDLIRQAQSETDFGSVDAAWLTAHEARCVRELGDQQRSRDLALSVQSLRASAPADPTAMAIVAAASSFVFNLSDWGERSVADLIQSSDTVSRWWRSQVIATGLGRHFDEGFKAWGRDTTINFGAGDTAWTSLRSATLLSAFAADHGGWQYASSLLARRVLMTAGGDKPDDLKRALDLLRLAGAEKDVSLVTQKLDAEGPVAVLSEIGADLDLTTVPRSAIKSSFTFIRYAGDVLAVGDADRHATWALETLDSADDFRARMSPSFLLKPAILEMLGGLMLTISKDMQRLIMDHVLALPILEDQYLAGRYARVINRIEDEVWSEEDIAKLSGRSGDNFELSNTIDGIIARRDPDFRLSLLQRVREGDLAALGSFGNITDLPVDVVRDLIAHLKPKIDRHIAGAKRGAYGLGGPDYGNALVLLNSWHPKVADWEPIEEMLTEPSSHPDHIAGAVEAIGQLRDHIPAEVLVQLKPQLASLTKRRPVQEYVALFSSRTNIRAIASLAIARCFPEEVTSAFLRELLGGDADMREAAVHVIIAREDPSQFSVVFMLAHDSDLEVRASAAEGLARWVSQGIAPSESLEVLREVLRSPGTALGKQVSRQIMGAPGGEARDLLLSMLDSHPSALVRARVAIARSLQ